MKFALALAGAVAGASVSFAVAAPGPPVIREPWTFGRSRYGWREIDGEFKVSGGRVGFSLTPEARSRRSIFARSVYGIQRVTTGSEVAMKALVFGKSAPELGRMLNHQRASRLQHTGT